MTHITEARAIGNHAGMGGPPPAASRKSLTVTEMLRSGVRRRVRGKEMAEAESTWDSEGGSVSSGAEGLPQTPTCLGH